MSEEQKPTLGDMADLLASWTPTARYWGDEPIAVDDLLRELMSDGSRLTPLVYTLARALVMVTRSDKIEGQADLALEAGVVNRGMLEALVRQHNERVAGDPGETEGEDG